MQCNSGFVGLRSIGAAPGMCKLLKPIQCQILNVHAAWAASFVSLRGAHLHKVLIRSQLRIILPIPTVGKHVCYFLIFAG